MAYFYDVWSEEKIYTNIIFPHRHLPKSVGILQGRSEG